MPHVIVTTHPSQLPDDVPVLLDEQVHSVHVANRHAAVQLIERIAWAIRDAEDAESARTTAPGERAHSPHRAFVRTPTPVAQMVPLA
jgi:hypothetical protein